ncbi:UDP-N-acetylglucosamine--dolichyl-phosphate N-acetylglucosaminephosphotransferase [Culicoides brevitarsis]|uniref:UDP-N-acetylglucosamine--dolichyl-phosphate N-acetylglucosaminephosphotransferase n=1 Tax=Culicoides brevitarsis TaxID=469753 RepID=UPI00307CC455
MDYYLLINFVISIGSYLLTVNLIPSLQPMFLKANLYGIDMNKKSSGKVPEAMGVVTGCIFLISLFLFIPVPFSGALVSREGEFPHHEFVELIAALLSICCMILLGFADDVLDLRWRHKLLLPTVASLPLLMVYYVNFGSTTVIMPNFVRKYIGFSLDIGFLYYIFMGMLAVFCTNAINILAGINGLEVGQSLVIAASIIVFNFIEIQNPIVSDAHRFSLYFMMPYFATTFALWKFNRYPSQVFVGDTFNYLSGMTFAVVGILGHFSKTILLFFIPQVINFIYSVPQLFHFIPCPRHRLPKYDEKTDLLSTSKTTFVLKDLKPLGKLCYYVFKALKLIQVEEKSDGTVISNNLTIINFAIILTGPIHERKLNYLLIGFQVACTLVAFTIRYPLAKFFYEYK